MESLRTVRTKISGSDPLLEKQYGGQDCERAAEALRAARAAGIDLQLDGDDLVLEASAPPPAVILDLLSRYKPGIVVLLRPGRDGWSPEDWQVFFDERAGIAEFDGGLPRPDAESRAFACCIVEWLNRNFVRSPPGRCLACSGGDSVDDALLPRGVESTGHAWLHLRCWPEWRAARRAEAVAALEAMGIKRSKFPDDFGKRETA
jgi:hypothetical protein